MTSKKPGHRAFLTFPLVCIFSFHPLSSETPTTLAIGAETWQPHYSKLAPGDAGVQDHLLAETSAFGNRLDVPSNGELQRATAWTISVPVTEKIGFNARTEKMAGDPDVLSLRPDMSRFYLGKTSYQAQRSSAGFSLRLLSLSSLFLNVRAGIERNQLTTIRQDIPVSAAASFFSEGLEGHSTGGYAGASLSVPLRFLSDFLPAGIHLTAFADLLRSDPLNGSSTFHSLQADGSWESGQAGMRIRRIRNSFGLSASIPIDRSKDSGPKFLSLSIGRREDRASYIFPGYTGLNQDSTGALDTNELVTDHILYGSSPSVQRLSGLFATASVTFRLTEEENRQER